MSVFLRNRIYQASIFFDLGRGRERLVISTGCTDKRAAAEMERKLGVLIESRVAGEQPKPELMQWVELLPGRIRKALADKGIVDPQRYANSAHIREHLDDYLDWCENINSQGDMHLGNKRTQLPEMIDFMKIERLSEITRAKVLAYRRAVVTKQSGSSHATANRHVAAFIAFVNWCVDEQRLYMNPIGRIRRLKEDKDPRRPRRPYTPDEVKKLIAVAPQYRKLVYLFAVYTGLRRGELKKTLVGNIDLEAKTLRVPVRVDKEDKESVLPLHPELIPLLTHHLANRGPRDPLFDRVPRIQTLRKDLAKAGIDRFNEENERLDFHALRTTLATELIRAGVPLSKVKLVTRHASTKVLEKHYAKLVHPDAESAIRELPSFTDTGEAEPEGNEDDAGSDEPGATEASSADATEAGGAQRVPVASGDVALGDARHALEGAGGDLDRRDGSAGDRGRNGVAPGAQARYAAGLAAIGVSPPQPAVKIDASRF